MTHPPAADPAPAADPVAGESEVPEDDLGKLPHAVKRLAELAYRPQEPGWRGAVGYHLRQAPFIAAGYLLVLSPAIFVGLIALIIILIRALI